MKKIKVCVVDDNRELVALLGEYISAQEDMEVMAVAHNGQECLKMLENDESGCFNFRYYYASFRWIRSARKIREMNRETMPNVIMLTAFGQEDVTKKAVDLGHPILF